MPPRLPSQLNLSLVSSTPYSWTSSIASSSRCSPACHRPGAQRFISSSSFDTSRRRFKAHATSRHQRSFHSTSPSLSSAKDPYAVLGVPKTATASEIKRRYYELARKHHPDTNKEPSSKDKFVEIQAAWDILSDDKKRAAYDQYGSASQQPGFDPNAFSNRGGPFGAGGFGGFQDFGQSFGGGARGQADLFESLFGGAFGGGGRSRAGPSKGEDLEATINISFIDACKGTSRTVNTTPIEDCGTCSGSGLKTGRQRTTCKTCGGTGTRMFVIDSGFQMASTCPTCQGTGSVVPKDAECGSCDGVGKVKHRRNVTVNVPSGIEDGMSVRVPGMGDAPISGKGKPGDLLVRVSVASSKVFRRQGTNLYHDARVPLHTALLGGKVRVPTLDGDVDVRVPSGTQPGEEAVLKGRGVPNVYGGSKGDLYVAFGVQLPRTLTPRQRAILEEFADDIEGRTPRTAEKASRASLSSTSQPSDEAMGPTAENRTDDETSHSNRSTGNNEKVTNDDANSPPPAPEKENRTEHRKKKVATG